MADNFLITPAMDGDVQYLKDNINEETKAFFKEDLVEELIKRTEIGELYSVFVDNKLFAIVSVLEDISDIPLLEMFATKDATSNPKEFLKASRWTVVECLKKYKQLITGFEKDKTKMAQMMKHLGWIELGERIIDNTTYLIYTVREEDYKYD